MSILDQRLVDERARLRHPMAFFTSDTRGRVHLEAPDDIRTCFERDDHRILHAKPFRRLRNKTQVFFSPENDHITTRMDHSLYVATIARTICRALSLNDDLAYAIALGHDLGHAPFGHSGERILNDMLLRHLPDASRRPAWSHEAQSLRVVDHLSRVSGRDFPGLNLSYEVRDGIRCHCGESREPVIHPRPASDERDPSRFEGRETTPITLEGCVVRMADRIAYLGRDYEDAQVALGALLPPLPPRVGAALGVDNRGIINTLVRDIIERNGRHREEIGFSDEVQEAALELRDFNYRHIYGQERLEAYRVKADGILVRIFEEAHALLARTPRGDWDRVDPEHPFHQQSLARFISGAAYDWETEPALAVVDWISLMSDGFAFKVFASMVLPEPLV
jgi:dGTPase